MAIYGFTLIQARSERGRVTEDMAPPQNPSRFSQKNVPFIYGRSCHNVYSACWKARTESKREQLPVIILKSDPYMP